jgi:hypothetical protein
MIMIKHAIFTLLVLAAGAMIAGCGTSARPGDASAAGGNSAITSSEGGQQANPQEATPYNQPLMATGGDLVMLRVRSGGIAG